MGILQDTMILLTREMYMYKKNLDINLDIAIATPIVFIILLGSFGKLPTNVPVAIVNYDNGLASYRFINMLQSGDRLRVMGYLTQVDAMSLLDKGSVVAVIVILPGFSDTSNSNSKVYMYLDNSQPQSAEAVHAAVDAATAEIGAQAATGASGSVPVVSTYAYGAGSSYKSFMIGGIVIVVAIYGSMFSTGITLLSDRELGNLKAFLTTPINKYSILLSKTIAGTLQSVFSAYLSIIIGLLYGASIAGGAVGFVELLWIILLVGFGTSALSIAFASKTNKFMVYAMLVDVGVLPITFLAGAFTSVNTLYPILQPLAVYNPLTYAVSATRDIMIKGALVPSEILVDSAILLAFSAVMLGIAALFFRDTSKQLS